MREHSTITIPSHYFQSPNFRKRNNYAKTLFFKYVFYDVRNFLRYFIIGKILFLVVKLCANIQ